MVMISAHVLQQAIELYLRAAYSTGGGQGAGTGVPAGTQARVAPIMALGASENVPEGLLEPESGVSTDGYALRLGQPLYPHMKLIVEPAPVTAGGAVPAADVPAILLRVDAHDRHLHAAPGSPDAAWLTSIRASNKELTEAIETAWAKAGLPTFKEYLRKQLEARRARQAEA